ncbi:LysR family transcriptional regulator [Pollutimonas subterranea]|uniref:LysR family transcriptional regulator n=1 Tax=Pollutimonas subterranea TaxID=2045210 RepID=A0A2N4U457_9BURK|nr:LysR family transcriptional regulator [Pollutimonas subterranea]PLC49808.1 LysR family transcriptional regulator [Pollutimonas subterranea]
MRFDLTDLRLFLNVQEAGTITGGAHRSHMTLASASERIKGMEDALGVALLMRDRRGVQITPAGRTLLHHARIVLQQMDRMRGDLDQYGKGLKGHVRLLCNTSALSEYLPEILSDFLARHPQVSVDLEEMLSYEIADTVRAGMADIGVVADSADLQGLETYAFRPDPLALIVARDHELAQRTSISLSEVAGYDFVGLVEGSALQEHVTFHARRAGKHLSYRVRLRSIEAVCRMVGQGIGIGVVPKTAAIRCARSARIKRLELTDAWASRDLMLCVRTAEELPAYVKQMMRHILDSAVGLSRK